MKRLIRFSFLFALLPLFIAIIPHQLHAKSLFSYQSGNWNGTNVWTTDSTGTTLVNSATPATGDKVYVLLGRTITLSANVNTTGHTVTINTGATLDLANYSLTSIILNGTGLLRTRRVSSSVALLPTITSGTFLGVEGGTVEYYITSGNAYIDDNIATYYNLVINLASTTQVLTIRRNCTVYGNLWVQSGTFQINDATTTRRIISITGNLTVDAGGKITVGTGNTNTSGYSITSGDLPPAGQFQFIFHQLDIGGNFVNNGNVRFTNLSAPNYGEFTSTGAVTVRMVGDTKDNSITLNGVTDFYNLIIDKGTDQTYILTVYSSSVSNFALYGPNNVGRNEASPYTADNPEVKKALWIRNGTLKLTGSILIPSLSEGRLSGSDGNGDYPIGSSAQLWVASPNVSVYSTATNATGFPEAPSGSLGVRGVGTDHQAISIFGTLRVTDGYVSARHSAGIIFWNTSNSSSAVILEGGTINTSVFRSTWTASGKTSYVQTGGTLLVRGDETENGEMGDAPIFAIPDPNSTFSMSGGEIIIRDRTNYTGAEGDGVYLNCDLGNYMVSGGTITFETNAVNTPTIDLNSKVNFWNLNIKRLGTSGNSSVILLQDLAVSNNVTIYPNSTFSAGTGDFNLSVGATLRISTSGTYTPNNNTTSMVGTGNYFLWNDGAITNGLYNFSVSKKNGILIFTGLASSFTIRNDLTILDGILADAGKIIYVSGNILNNATHLGAGRISMAKTNGSQTISGNGKGSFQNLELNNTNGTAGSVQITLAADITITGVLTLTNDRKFNLSHYGLTLSSLAAIQGTMSSNRFITTSGLPSDRGITRAFIDTAAFVYPMGSGTNYTPATIRLKKIPGEYGSITVKPVPAIHPFATSTHCMATYWKVEQIGFDALQSKSVELIFNYGNLTDNTTYIPGKYNPAFWTLINDVSLVDEAANTIKFPGESKIFGDYTAGAPDAFDTIVAFYSRNNGAWSSPSTWSNIAIGGAPATTIPGATNPVFIGDGAAYNHTVTVTSAGAVCSTLGIKSGSVLDLGTTTGHNFGYYIVDCPGKLRISSNVTTATFPAGDFGNLLGTKGGTVEFYSYSTIDYTLPTTSASPSSYPLLYYCNLQLSPGTGRTITLPNLDLSIYSNLIIQGTTSTGIARPSITAARNLYVLDDILVNSGTFQFQNNFAQTIRVDSTITIASGATFNVAGSGTGVPNGLYIKGNLINNGIFDMSSSTTRYCDVYFVGSDDRTVSGTGSTTDLFSAIIDKGTTFTPTLNVTSSTFTFSNNSTPLTLINGTFRLSSSLTLSIATDAFSIPPTARLSANGGTITLASTASDDADLALAGVLEILAGAINIGVASNNVNNDIVYAGAGYPTLSVTGGSLFVNGQIRRNVINGLGSLRYFQSGSSSVVINGRNVYLYRSKLEVLNDNSVFNMSGGTITIVRGTGTTYNDLYLRPDSSSVTGGTIVFGSSSTESTSQLNSFTLNTAIPLFNLTVDGTTNSKTVTLNVKPLVLIGNLTINGSSVFNTDSLNVTIGGGLFNNNSTNTTGLNVGGYRPMYPLQTTTFNGKSDQVIGGVSGNNTNFANLIINHSNSSGTITLQPNTQLTVNTDLFITKGILADGGNIIRVSGDISNSSTHSGAGRIELIGSVIQQITGNGLGIFGNIYLNQSFDVKLSVPTTISGVLTFRTKMLDIGSNLLTLANTSAGAISGSSSTSYIRTDGLISDAGVQKYYPTGALDFTFPLGIVGKYTPARLYVSANTAAGTITVVPVNFKHPCTTNSSNYQLNYYWHVTSTGFAGLTISHYYTYMQSDVTGTESSYYGARYYNLAWTLGPAVNTSSNLIQFPTVNYINGDYTAGYSSEFGTVYTYYSRNATLGGNWDNVNTWSTVSHAGAAATTYPTGQPVVIATGHTVNTNGNSRSSESLALNGTAILNVSNSIGHSFGTVTGTGTIKLSLSNSGYFVFPSGNFSVFTSPAGGTVELNVTSGTGTLPYLTTYNNLILSGAGTKAMSDADITINGLLSNMATGTFVASSINQLILNSDWQNGTTFTHNGGITVFNGTTNLSGSVMPNLNRVIISQGQSLTPASGSLLMIDGDFTNNGTFNHNNGAVTFNGNTTLYGTSATVFNDLSIGSQKTLTGKLNDTLVLIGNWLNSGTFNHNDGAVKFDGSTIIQGSSHTNFGSMMIATGKNLTGPLNDTVGCAGNFINKGTFSHNGSMLMFNGRTQQISGSSTVFKNLGVTENSTTTINSTGNTVRGVLFCSGILNVLNNLTLVSTATETALVDGTGTGDVLGNLDIQRYLPDGFGYKYFSSPFQASTVNEFSDDMNLNATFPTLYRYDENRYVTGWLNYTNTSGLLIPMQGYAVNFGPTRGAKTMDMSGVVNNNTLLPQTLKNSNRPYTKGFNLMGNPYPSPIDWDSQNWIRSNIDNALYYFDAGISNQYLGTYSTYINGISSNGIANNIIPAMQGFFIHVSNGTYPVQGTIIFTNNIRINTFNPTFHKKQSQQTRELIRITAKFAEENRRPDPMIIYFEDDFVEGFESNHDAIKLMNTDYDVPNFYSLTPDSLQLAIQAYPTLEDSLEVIPLGMTLEREGPVYFDATDLTGFSSYPYIYFKDKKTGRVQNLYLHSGYQTFLDNGITDDRFELIFSKCDLRYQKNNTDPYTLYSSLDRLFVDLDIPEGESATLLIFNMLGQEVYHATLTGNGYHELDISITPGIYVSTITSSAGTLTKKIFLGQK